MPNVNTRVLKRVEDLECEIPPIWCCGHWVLPKHLAQAVLGMDTMKRQRPLGLAVLLHWKGYLVVRDGGYGQGSIGPPQVGGGKSGPRKCGRTVAEASTQKKWPVDLLWILAGKSWGISKMWRGD